MKGRSYKLMSGLDTEILTTKNFAMKYYELQQKYGTQMTKLNGVDECQLNYTEFIDNFVDEKTVADASIDANANVKTKDIVTLMREMSKPQQKILSFNKIHYDLEKLFGFQMANKWLEYEWTGRIYTHDPASASLVSYCFAYDLQSMAEKGLFFLDDRRYEPTNHLITFVDFVKEFISYNSNRTSGACGLPNLLPYMFYFWKRDVEEGYYLRNPEYYAKQNFQRFIFAVNQPFVRDGSQSAFTNTSVFDRPYFEALFGGMVLPDGRLMIDFEDEFMEFQKWYMETMSDIRKKNMFTFPVNTISLLRKDGKFEDEDFAKWAVKHNMQWSDSNLFIDDSVTSLSNCCRLKSNIEDLGYVKMPYYPFSSNHWGIYAA